MSQPGTLADWTTPLPRYGPRPRRFRFRSAGGAAVTPQEDARVLLALVDRPMRALRLNLDPSYPDEE